ncbi:MAG: hypothetical protein WC584_03365 [Candidatus Pacearchaeota archaeon]
MLNRKEIGIIILVTLVLAFTLSVLNLPKLFLFSLLFVFLVISINIIAKKLTAFYLDSEIEIKLWEFQRYGFKPDYHFKKPVPAGVLAPIILAGITLGYFKWLASLVFDVKAKTYRATKRHGLYAFSEMTEFHIGLIAASGIFANLIFAVIGYLINFPEFSRINIYYAFFNMIPLSELDGNKIFFGSIILWSFLAALTLVGLALAFLVV